MYLCHKCGRKLTGQQVNFVERFFVNKNKMEFGKRPFCKKCFDKQDGAVAKVFEETE